MLRMSGRFHWGCFKMMMRTPGTVTITKLCCRGVTGSLHSLKSHTPGLNEGLIKSKMSPGGAVSWGEGTKSVWGVHNWYDDWMRFHCDIMWHVSLHWTGKERWAEYFPHDDRDPHSKCIVAVVSQGGANSQIPKTSDDNYIVGCWQCWRCIW